MPDYYVRFILDFKYGELDAKVCVVGFGRAGREDRSVARGLMLAFAVSS